MEMEKEWEEIAKADSGKVEKVEIAEPKKRNSIKAARKCCQEMLMSKYRPQWAPPVHILGKRHRRKQKKRIGALEKLEILHAIFCQNRTQKSCVFEFEVSAGLVSSVVRAAKKDVLDVELLIKVNMDDEEVRECVKSLLLVRSLSESPFNNLGELRKIVKMMTGQDVSHTKLSKILQQEFNYSYQKLQRRVSDPNTPAVKLLRRDFSARFLRAMASGKRILNIDESYFNYTNFKRRAWVLKGSGASTITKQIIPRLALLTAMDQFGRVYVSFS